MDSGGTTRDQRSDITYRSTVYRPGEERSFFHSNSISGFGPDIYSFPFLLIIIDGWSRTLSLFPPNTRTRAIRKLCLGSLPFNLSPLHASITFSVFLPCHLLPSRLVSSRLVSSRHGKHPTSFFTVLRCITIDRSHARHSIRNNSGTRRDRRSSKGGIVVDLKRSVSLLLPLHNIFRTPSQALLEKFGWTKIQRKSGGKSKLRAWALRLTGSCCRTRPRIERRRNIYSRYIIPL